MSKNHARVLRSRNLHDDVMLVLVLQVISGHQLPFRSEGSVRGRRELSVQVRVCGVDADVQHARTKSVRNNGEI